MQPLYATLLSYPKQYVTALCNRLWKRYVTACLVTYPVMQPLMETVCNRLSSYLPCYATAYGNGISPPKIPCKTL